MNPKKQGQGREKLDFEKMEYLISDWDGTLSDSMLTYTASFTKTLNEAFGIASQDSRKYFLSTAGEALSNQLRVAAKNFAGIEIQDSTQLENTFWRNLTGFKPDIIDGAKEFLTKLKKRGIKIIVWSGTRTDVLKEKIKLLSFSGLIDFAIGNEPGSSSLVKGPGLFAKIAEHSGVSEDELRQKS
ncbi:MAG: HAD hydrolase-like protein, partial [Patescibacteria group bacterium]